MACWFSDHFASVSCTEVLVFSLVALVTWFLWDYLRTPANLPPGPRGLPILGYLPYLTDKPHEKFHELAKTYGSVFSVKLGSKLVIVLNTHETIKEALVKQAENFAARPSTMHKKNFKAPTIFDSEGEVFKDYKRFTLSTLREFGFGKLSMEPRIHEEIQFLLTTIEKLGGKATDIGDLIRMSISNVICAVKFGKRFDYDNPKFMAIIELLNEHMRRSQPINLEMFIPLFFKIPGFAAVFGSAPSLETAKKMNKTLREIVQTRSASHVDGSMSDFTDAWLTEAKNRGEETGKNFTNDHLVRVLQSLFLAGSDTTSNTIRWGILYLMVHTDVQEKVHKEMDDVIGRERTPAITDRENMPYTEATLNEIQRLSTLVPLAIPHSNFEAATVAGYHIPKRSVVLPNLWAVHHDPDNFVDPKKFNPARFLNAEGKLMKAEKLIPFSTGKRQCLGESLAKMELFLYFTSLFQRFTFKKPEGETLSFDYKFGFVSIPRAHKVCAIVRK